MLRTNLLAAALAAALCASALALDDDASGAPPAHPSVGFQPQPLSVATDAAGHVYLSNSGGNGQVQKFTSGGALLARWGNLGRKPGADPRAIATDAAGNVYVADGRTDWLSAYTPGGELVRRWRSFARDISIGPAGYLYAVAGFNVQKLTLDGSPVAKWGGPGDGDGQLGEAWGIAAGASGSVYVADTYRDRIQAFDADGGFLGKWGSNGSAGGQLHFPYGIATGPAGSVYVADTVNNRVQKFSAAGQLIAAWGSIGGRPGQFYTPTSIATGPAGEVYVADAGVPYLSAAGDARVQRFTADGGFVTQWHGAPALPRPARPRLFSAVRKKTARRGATFRFRSRQRGVRLQCRLTGRRAPRRLRRWRDCASPQRYHGLRPGRKVFHVRAVKDLEAGRPARRSWRIDGPR